MISISGGAFQDSEGNPLANGTLMLKLSWDSTENLTTPNGTIYAGPRIKIALDASGNCPTTAIWSNAELEIPTYYSVNLFDVNGVPVLESPLTWNFTATGTLAGTCKGTNGDTISIGGIVYTLRNTLALPYDVLIGASTAAQTAANLVAAINAAAAGAGTTYGTGTVANTDVTAALSGSNVLLTSILSGANGNSITTVASSTCFSFPSATLTGGGVATPVDLGTTPNTSPSTGAVFVPVPGPQGPQGVPGPAGTSVGSSVGAFEYIIDGGGSTPGTGVYGTFELPTNCTITGWSLIADAAGSAVIDVLKSTFSAFPTNSSIAGSDKPTLASGQKQQNLTLTAWSTTLLQGDVVQFNLVSVTTCKRLCLTIFVSIP